MIDNRRVSEVDGKKYILQHPLYNNCLVIAILNAALDDDQNIPLEKMFKYEKMLQKKYNISENGLDVTMAGCIAYDWGYASSLELNPIVQFPDIQKCVISGYKKIIRIHGWRRNVYDYAKAHLYDECKKYISQFKMKKDRSIVTNASGYGCHAFFVRHIVESTHVFGINVTIGVNGVVNWRDITLSPERLDNEKIVGSELCILLRKIK
jgi:hypothetical protein